MATDNSKYGITREDLERAALSDFDDYEPSASVSKSAVNAQPVNIDIFSDNVQDAVCGSTDDIYSDSGETLDNAFIFCTACGNQLVADAKFCTACGNPIAVSQNDVQYENDNIFEDVQYADNQLNNDYQYADNQILSDSQFASDVAAFCTACGAQLSPEMRFCTSCGTPVETQNDVAQYDDNQGVNYYAEHDDTPTRAPLDNSIDIQQSQQYVAQNDSFVFCTGCGAKLPSDMRFCTSCGTPVDNGYGFENANHQPQKGSFFSKFKKNK